MSSTLEDIRRGIQRKLTGETIWGDIYTTVNGNIAAPTTTITLPTTFKSSFIADDHFQGWYFYVCDNNADSDGTPPGTCIRIVSYDASAGAIVVDENLSESGAHNCLDTGCEIELTPHHPKLVEQCINEFLSQTYYPYEWPISIVNIENNDMEHSTVATGWTQTAHTQTAEATLVFHGAQSLKLAATNDTNLSKSADIDVVGTEDFRIYAACKCTDGDTGTLIVYDETGTANIVSITAQEERWQLLSAGFQVPATSEQITVRLQCGLNTDITYWDDVQLISGRRTYYKLPSWITEDYQVQDVVVYKGAGQLADDSYNYMPDEARVSRWPHWRLVRDGSSFRLKLHTPFGAGRPRLRALRPYAELAAPSAATPTGGTTICHEQFAIQGGFVTVLERLAATRQGEDREAYYGWFLKEKAKLDRMRADFQPWARSPKRDIQGEGLFGLSEAG